jgi:Copper transport outer membrane protein, MctB
VIDFRYHLVSIIAVFLALAVGVVLGSAALNGPITKQLQKSVVALRHEENNLGSLNRSQKGQIGNDQQFEQAAEPVLLSHLLAGQRVVLVTAPGAPSAVTDGVTQALTQAGAKVTGQVAVQSMFFDPSSSTRATLGLVTQKLTPIGVSLRSGSAQAQAAQLIASAILTEAGVGQPAAGSQDSAGAAILSGFAARGFLSVSEPAMVRATLAVVISPGSPSTTNASKAASQALVAFSEQLSTASQATVVVGSVNGSGPGSDIQLIRSASSTGSLSTVDNADTVSGQIVVAQALYEFLTTAKPGAYGTGSGASTIFPTPMPTPSPSSSAVDPRSGHPSASPSATGAR